MLDLVVLPWDACRARAGRYDQHMPRARRPLGRTNWVERTLGV